MPVYREDDSIFTAGDIELVKCGKCKKKRNCINLNGIYCACENCQQAMGTRTALDPDFTIEEE